MRAPTHHRLEIEGTGAVVPVGPEETILKAALRAGIALPHDCTLGGCGTCRIKVLSGAVIYPDPDDLPFGLAPEEAAAGYALACQARPCGDLLIEAPKADALPVAARHRARVRTVELLAPDLFHWSVEMADGEAVPFVPGQYMNVLLEDGPRSFSMASAPGAPVLDFFVRRFAGGRFTDHGLAALRPGDAVDVEIPLGQFLYRPRDDRPLVMAATGTGIAPIKAILESLLDDDDTPPIDLYWGMRREEDLFLGAEIAAWGTRLPEFRFVPVLSRPAPGWDGRRGYVQDAVAADHPDLSGHAIYLCGSPDMILGAKRAVIAQGACPDHIYAEGFTHQGAG